MNKKEFNEVKELIKIIIIIPSIILVYAFDLLITIVLTPIQFLGWIFNSKSWKQNEIKTNFGSDYVDYIDEVFGKGKK